MSPLRFSALLFFLFWSGLSSAQQFSIGIGVETGTSWEIERLPYTAAPTTLTGVEGGLGYAVTLEAQYAIDALSLALRPTLLIQETTVFRLPGDDSGMSFREKLFPTSFLLPLRANLHFGHQRFQPVLGLAAGFLIDIQAESPLPEVPVAEPVLPYLEVSVGVRFSVGTIFLRPELSVRNGTGELFSAGRKVANQPFGGQRWGYAGFGVVISN